GPLARMRPPARGRWRPQMGLCLGPGLGSESNQLRYFEPARRWSSVFQLILDAPELFQRAFQAHQDRW
ncbi:MAG: hypothetical protein WAW52_05835, partial [Methanothrix sp.]